MILCQKDATVHSPSYCILLTERAFRDKKSDDIIYFFAAGDVSRETSLAAKSEEKRMFSQATLLVTRVQFYPFTGICPAFAKWSDTFETKAYFLVVSFSNKKFARHDVLLWGRSKYQETVRKVFFARSDWLLKLGISSAFGQSERPQTRDGQMASRLAAVYKINCEEISQINEEAVPDNTKKATKLGLAVFHYR